MVKISAHICILGTVFFTVVSQVLIKLGVDRSRPFPSEIADKIIYLFEIVFSPYVFIGLLTSFFAAMCWLVAIKQLPLSYAYPFTSLNYLLIMIVSSLVFGEAISVTKIVGNILLVLGIIICSR